MKNCNGIKRYNGQYGSGLVPGAVGVQDFGNGQLGAAQQTPSADFMAMVAGSDPSQINRDIPMNTVVDAAKKQRKGMSLQDLLPSLGMGAMAGGLGGAKGIIAAGVMGLLQSLMQRKQQGGGSAPSADFLRMVGATPPFVDQKNSK